MQCVYGKLRNPLLQHRALPQYASIYGAAATMLLCGIAIAGAPPDAESQRTLSINRTWDVLPDPSLAEGDAAARDAMLRHTLAEAGRQLGSWSIHVAGSSINGARLTRWASSPTADPLLRTIREDVRRAIDLPDFLLFIDDVLRSGQEGGRGEIVWVTSGRARGAGITIHPDGVFRNKPRHYAERSDSLNIDRPKSQAEWAPARNGEPLGPKWTRRYRNPSGEAAKMRALKRDSPNDSYAPRIKSLIRQLRRGGADVWVNATVRHRERGYLMWGAFILSRADSPEKAKRLVGRLNRFNREWGLNIPIRWKHPDGLLATIEAARQMADAYDVVYATKAGARGSNHYDAVAIDMTSVGLPRQLTLRAPNGHKRTFNFGGANEPRDLSLTPRLIEWIEENFQLEKLRSDYPHWNDAAPPPGATDPTLLRGG